MLLIRWVADTPSTNTAIDRPRTILAHPGSPLKSGDMKKPEQELLLRQVQEVRSRPTLEAEARELATAFVSLASELPCETCAKQWMGELEDQQGFAAVDPGSGVSLASH